LSGEITRYFEYLCPSIGDSKARRNLFLGIDVGGTFVKFQCYKDNDENNLWCPYNESFKILTGVPNGYSEAKDFVKRLIEAIKEHLSSDDIKRIVAVGIAWPGPIRNNRLAGISGILRRNFNKFKTGEASLSVILELDIVGALKECWCDKEFQPIVAIANDGDAHAFGVVGLDPTMAKKEGTLVVIKAGTGTAGSVFRYGRLADGLMEFGKLLLNVGAKPDYEKKFLNGVVNAYCSSKTLPELAQKRALYLKEMDNLDSVEIGYMLGLDTNNLDECIKTLKGLQIR